MNLETRDVKQLTSLKSYIYSPKFLPGNQKIVFLQYISRDKSKLFSINIDGSNLNENDLSLND